MTLARCGSWRSPIDARVITEGSKGYGELRARGAALFWTESRPEEAGRSTLITRVGDALRELTPSPFNPRSRVHEYGGGSYCLSEDHAYFLNFTDQNVYEVSTAADQEHGPRQVTQGDAATRFADLTWDGRALLAVRERHDAGGTEPVNDLVRIGVADGSVSVLHEGHDFYAAPRPSGDGRIAFLVWDHPNMPFDGCQLLVAEDHGNGLLNPTIAAGGANESIVQPVWNGERLLFVSDLEGYWNLYAYDGSGVYAVLPDAAEYAGPAWYFANTYYVPVGQSHVVARRVENGTPSLVLVDLDQGLASPLDDASSSYLDIVRTPNGVAYIAGFADRPKQIVELRLDTRTCTPIAQPGDSPVGRDFIAIPEALTFPAKAGDSHAFFYPPRSRDHRPPPGEAPPLLVTTHGGPTANAWADLDWRVQYYTSRGWAVADVNYGGSTGFGRAYRERLDGAWGQTDIDDCVACVHHLVAQGRVDPARVAIKGGSAGGYTTLAALAFTNVFRAGASHFGVSDLNALAADTHKFESRYLDTLLGSPEALVARSPINHVDKLNCPVIFFQGSEDKVVPPNQAESMRDALAAKGIPVAYMLFEGEGHGFRRAENVRRAIEAEYAFFAKVFGFEPADDLPAVEIDTHPGTG
ncbi:MAG: S9 family peptidase [Gammaproteobacteria bacterium]|nr:S9 family peptidase [Gammaproteobacteria bacterium]MYF27615.1 S9 family peptidase [Gammaproteobacteria bacterium]MYK48112.1 S9 family peptidase [Gammaproteobacteria bacterium]